MEQQVGFKKNWVLVSVNYVVGAKIIEVKEQLEVTVDGEVFPPKVHRYVYDPSEKASDDEYPLVKTLIETLFTPEVVAEYKAEITLRDAIEKARLEVAQAEEVEGEETSELQTDNDSK